MVRLRNGKAPFLREKGQSLVLSRFVQFRTKMAGSRNGHADIHRGPWTRIKRFPTIAQAFYFKGFFRPSAANAFPSICSPQHSPSPAAATPSAKCQMAPQMSGNFRMATPAPEIPSARTLPPPPVTYATSPITRFLHTRGTIYGRGRGKAVRRRGGRPPALFPSHFSA